MGRGRDLVSVDVNHLFSLVRMMVMEGCGLGWMGGVKFFLGG